MSEAMLVTIIISVFSLIGAIGTYVAIREINKATQRQAVETADSYISESTAYENKSWNHMLRLTLYYVGSVIVILMLYFMFFE